jgi:hypothetical protein
MMLELVSLLVRFIGSWSLRQRRQSNEKKRCSGQNCQ